MVNKYNSSKIFKLPSIFLLLPHCCCTGHALKTNCLLHFLKLALSANNRSWSQRKNVLCLSIDSQVQGAKAIMESNYSILRCNPVMASLREEEILEDKKIVFLNCLIFAVWVNVAFEPMLQDSSTLSFEKPSDLLWALNLPSWVLVCYWQMVQSSCTCWDWMRNRFISRLPTKEARQEQVSVNMIPLIKTDTSLFPQGKGCSVQWPRRGVPSSNSFSYSNLGCDIGHITSLSKPQFSHLRNKVSD